MELIQSLNWRYAVKRMTGEKVPAEKIEQILEAARLSASSVGLQPYKVIVVENETLKKKLQPAAYNQPQIVEASHLLVFAAYEKITAKDIDDYISLHATVKNTDVSNLADFKNKISSSILSRSDEANFNWAAKQAYIALGTALIAAAEAKVDATPMEGFDPAAVDDILGLPQLGLKSVTILALGYRDAANDFLVNAPKVRRDMKDFAVHLN